MTKPTGNPRGRPPKKVSPNPVGRPRDPKKAMKEFRDRILNSPKSAKVIEAVYNAALDPEHKNQAAAWHILIDRLAPKGMFEAEVSKAEQGQKIQVTITTAGGDVNISDTIDGEFKEVEDPKDQSQV